MSISASITLSAHRNGGLALTLTGLFPPQLPHGRKTSEAQTDVFQAKASALFLREMHEANLRTERQTKRNQCSAEKSNEFHNTNLSRTFILPTMNSTSLDGPQSSRRTPSSSTTSSQKGASTRILIADHHPLIRDGLLQLISSQTDLSCCAQAGSVADTKSLAAKHRPHLVILDFVLKGGDGLELIKILKSQSPVLRILIFSQHGERPYVERTLRAG